MDNLTIALACAGGAVLAGVVLHGAWQARKAGPRRPTKQPKPSLEPREPVLAGDPFAPAGHEETTQPAMLLVNPEGSDLVGAPMPPPVRKPYARIDALIDAIATLTLEAPISGDFALQHAPASRRAGTKSLLVEGLNVESAQWEAPYPGQRYSEFQAAVQLANRTGALNEIEYSEFVQKVQAFSESIGAMADFPDMLDVVSRARELDHFASQYDAQLAVHLHARAAAWSVGYIQQHASRHGFVPGLVPGRLVLPSDEEGAPPVLVLSFDAQAALADDPNQSALRTVMLSFDVPQTAVEADPFSAWQASAQALALGMDAAVIDDNGHPLSVEGFAAIGAELGRLYDALASRDLAAGSPATRRLFS